jgi:hypothetical protein
MTEAVNQEQIVGSLIPDVYLKTVTLETAGTVIRETNPHIEHAREAIKRSKKPTNNSLQVTLDLLLKEELDNGLIDSWFSDQEFQKYLRFTVIQSTDPLVTKIMSASNNAIQVANINSFTEAAVFVAELMGELKDLPEFTSFGNHAPAYSEEDIPELMELIFDNTTVKFVSVKEHMLNNKSLLTQQQSSVTDTGHRIYDFTFRVKFELPTRSPDHLSYFIVSSIDIDQIIADFNLDTTDAHLFELMNGKVALDTVVSNGTLVSKSFLFKDADGSIWSGPVHQSGAMWLTGTPESENKQPVVKHEVENNKIQDFRNFDDIDRLQLDFSVVENRLFNRNLPFKRLTNDNMDVTRTENYFSEIALARDSRGACRFAFALDYGKVIQNHTKYGALYNKNNLDELFANVRMRSLIIKRRRVTRDQTTLNKLGSPTYKRQVFSDDDPIDIICYAGESTPGKLTPPDAVNGTVRELVVEMDAEFDEIRHFMGVDKSMPLVTDGYYQYGIEIEVEDNTHKFILQKLRELTIAKYWLDYYYNLSALPNHFDVLSNRFTQEFIDKMYDEYGWGSGKKPLIKSPWISPIITYLSTLSFFRKAPVDLTLAGSMWKYVDPKSGNPRGVAMIQKLMENLMQRLASVVGVNLSPRRSRGVRANGSGDFVAPSSVLMPGRPQLKTFKLEYYFPQVFDSNLPKDVGFDFLSRGALEKESNEDGLRTISRSDYKKRTELESLKYFKALNSNINMRLDNSVSFTKNDSLSNTSYTYLTPSNVSLSKKGNINLLENPFDGERNFQIQSTIASINLSKKSPFLPPMGVTQVNLNAPSQIDQPMLEMKSDMTSIMSAFNCTLITPISSPFYNLAQLLTDDYDPYTDTEDIMGTEWMGVDEIASSAGAETDDNENEINLNPVPLFAGLAFPFFMFGTGMSGIFSKQNTVNNMKDVNGAVLSSFSMDFYDLTNPTGAAMLFNTSLNPLAVASSTAPSISGDNNFIGPKTMATMAALPHQIKSLFLSNTSKDVVRYDWTGPSNSLLQTPIGKASFILNYKMIRRTEVMTGYHVDDNGMPMLKNPIWKPLTPKLLRSAGNNDLLCRTVRYENKAFGVHEAKSMRMPVYNKYFVITNAGTQDNSLLRRGRMLYRDKLSKRVNRILRQHRFIRGEYLSTAVVSSKRIVPKAATKASVQAKTDMTKNIKKGTKVI